MAKYLVRSIFLFYIFVLSGSIQSHTLSDNENLYTSDTSREQSGSADLYNGQVASTIINESNPSNGWDHWFRSHLAEPVEEQEVKHEFKSTPKKKLDSSNDINSRLCTLAIAAFFATGSNPFIFAGFYTSIDTPESFIIFRNLRI